MGKNQQYVPENKWDFSHSGSSWEEKWKLVVSAAECWKMSTRVLVSPREPFEGANRALRWHARNAVITGQAISRESIEVHFAPQHLGRVDNSNRNSIPTPPAHIKICCSQPPPADIVRACLLRVVLDADQKHFQRFRRDKSIALDALALAGRCGDTQPRRLCLIAARRPRGQVEIYWRRTLATASRFISLD